MTNNDNDTNRRDTAPADQDWFGGRRWTGIAAVGFLIVIALCVVVVVVINRDGGNANNAAGGTSSTSAPATSSTSTTGTAPTAALPTAVPTSAPAGVTWSIYQTVALPSLPGAGPAEVARCNCHRLRARPDRRSASNRERVLPLRLGTRHRVAPSSRGDAR